MNFIKFHIKKLILIILVCVLIFVGATTFSKNNQFPEEIKSFFVTITINKEGSFLVKEEIVYDFGENYRHGIYRDIPLGDTLIDVKDVTDNLGNSYKYETHIEGNILRIKIGDPKKKIKGEHTYNIYYEVWNGINFFSNRDELSWNAIGTEWNVPIKKSGVIVRLPEKLPKENLRLSCFTGVKGSMESNCVIHVKENGEIVFESQKIFMPKEGLTIVVAWPKGIIKDIPNSIKIHLLLRKIWPVIIPFFVFVYLFIKWLRKGKDFKIKKPIVVQYEPPDNLRPAEVGLILNQRITGKEITATLIDLAVRGYIKIQEVFDNNSKDKDFELIKLKDFENKQDDLREYEREILRKIFGSKNKILVSELENIKNNLKLSTIAKKLFSETGKKYFVSNPQKIQDRLIVNGISIIIISILLALLVNNEVLFLAGLLSGFLLILFSKFMPKKTKKGIEAYWHILGFRNYINTAEKHRIKFQEKENIFERFLPYAIVFGLTEKWLKVFEELEDERFGDFSYKNFNNVVVSIDNHFSSLNFEISSLRGSGFGGGGGVGSGGGGGGGGSW
ncbi:MAG: DUF2207 domain-containing protein [Candidatus Aenigmatarchaeota archaeon]